MLLTVYTGQEMIERLRKKLTIAHIRADEVKLKFGSKHRKELLIPLITDCYNNYINGVNVGD